MFLRSRFNALLFWSEFPRAEPWVETSQWAYYQVTCQAKDHTSLVDWLPLAQWNEQGLRGSIVYPSAPTLQSTHVTFYKYIQNMYIYIGWQ